MSKKKMENKRTAVDILFQEIKESKSFLPDNLFGYLEDVYNKAKALDENELYSAIEAAIIRWNLDGTKTAGSLTREIILLIKQQSNG
jgi:hypothetical protein